MSTQEQTSKLRVVIAGGGVAGLEAALALGELAPGLTATTVLAPNSEFVDRPMTVREPFAYPQANRYALEPIVRDAGAELVADELAWVDPVKRVVHTRSDGELEYDVLVLALGARITPRYKHAITIDDRQLDETLHGLIQDVEEGYVKSVAFVAPGRMAWPLPLYELALMTSTRAFDMDVEVDITIVTPEDSPLAIFGSLASSAIGDRLTKAKIKTITSAYAEIPRTGEIVINPGDRYLKVDRVVALPELYGPSVRGVPLSEHGFLRVDSHCKLVDMEGIYAAGDATEFAIKHGGVSSQQADAAAESIAALAGAPLTPQQFHPVIRGMLLTGDTPLYLTARITGGQGFSSEITDEPTWSPPSKVASKYLAPYLAAHAPATR
jgi:sulfide:quinone oxidoreductase